MSMTSLSREPLLTVLLTDAAEAGLVHALDKAGRAWGGSLLALRDGGCHFDCGFLIRTFRTVEQPQIMPNKQKH